MLFGVFEKGWICINIYFRIWKHNITMEYFNFDYKVKLQSAL